MKNERILILGAGAIGSIFGGMIAASGYDVTFLARGKRFDELVRNGVILEDALSGRRRVISVKTIDTLDENDIYEYIIVAVQNTQIDSVLPIVSKNRSRNIVFTVNNPVGYKKWIDAVGADRILIGFPSAGGERKDGVVRYFIGKGLAKLFQATTFGEIDGRKSERLLTLINIFRKSGFSPDINKDMDAWQKTHVAVILPICKALYRFDCNNYTLSGSYSTIRKMVFATRECFEVLKAVNSRITPGKLNFYYLPAFIIVPFFMVLFNTKIAEFSMAKHTIFAKDELDALQKQFTVIRNNSGRMTPHFDAL